MSCPVSSEELALHVEGDLPEAAARRVSRHVASCGGCRRFLEQLQARQSLLKSLRWETASAAECTDMRRAVMSIIHDRPGRIGWALRAERALMLGLRRRPYAVATLALLGMVSASALARIRSADPEAMRPMAVFDGRDTLVRPEGYRDWIVVGTSTDLRCAGGGHEAVAATDSARHDVYIDPAGYREYAKTGAFAEGTLIVWELAGDGGDATGRSGRPSPVLLASVKDSARFDGGWGFFDFTGEEGARPSKARALPESSGCRTCHRRDAQTDHVFTQFHPELRSARHGAQLAAPATQSDVVTQVSWSRPARSARPSFVART